MLGTICPHADPKIQNRNQNKNQNQNQTKSEPSSKSCPKTLAPLILENFPHFTLYLHPKKVMDRFLGSLQLFSLRVHCRLVLANWLQRFIMEIYKKYGHRLAYIPSWMGDPGSDSFIIFIYLSKSVLIRIRFSRAFDKFFWSRFCFCFNFIWTALQQVNAEIFW